MLANESARCQVKDLGPLDRRVKGPIEFIERPDYRLLTLQWFRIVLCLTLGGGCIACALSSLRLQTVLIGVCMAFTLFALARGHANELKSIH
jgi:hypothetical protein